MPLNSDERVFGDIPFVDRDDQRAAFLEHLVGDLADPAPRARASHRAAARRLRRNRPRGAHRRPTASRACPRPWRFLRMPGGVDQPDRARSPSASCHSQSIAIESRVIPASGPVISRSSPSMRLIRVDLPAFGRPTIASLSGRARARPPLPRRPLVLVALDDAAAAPRTGRPCPRHARREIAIGSPRPSDQASSTPVSPARPSALLATRIDRRRRAAQPAGDLLVERRHAGARVDQEQRDIGLARPRPRSARASGRAGSAASSSS